MLPKHANVSVHMHERHEMASPVTPVNGSAFALVHQAIQETLAHGRVRAPSTALNGCLHKARRPLQCGPTLATHVLSTVIPLQTMNSTCAIVHQANRRL